MRLFLHPWARPHPFFSGEFVHAPCELISFTSPFVLLHKTLRTKAYAIVNWGIFHWVS
jgi:hypothetical protein